MWFVFVSIICWWYLVYKDVWWIHQPVMRNNKPTSETAGPLWPLVPGDIPTVNFHHYLSLTYPQYIGNYEYNVMSEWGRRILVRSWQREGRQGVFRQEQATVDAKSNRNQDSLVARGVYVANLLAEQGGIQLNQAIPEDRSLVPHEGRQRQDEALTSCPPPLQPTFLRPPPSAQDPPHDTDCYLASGRQFIPGTLHVRKKHMCNHGRFPNCWIFPSVSEIWKPPSTNPFAQVYRTEIHGCVSPIGDVLLSTAYTTDKKTIHFETYGQVDFGVIILFQQAHC